MSDNTTPRPWTTKDSPYGFANHILENEQTVSGPEGEPGPVALVSGSADAALIVRAVNAHNQTVQALAEVSRVLHERNQAGWEDRLCGIVDAALQNARAS